VSTSGITGNTSEDNPNGFLPSLFDWMEANFCIDTAREYSTGMSNGAMMSYQLGSSLSTRLAAIAPVAGSYHVGFLQPPSRCVPMLDIHGTGDDTIPSNLSVIAQRETGEEHLVAI
jgi:polyhydroxybutyrate depolymerase